jgi:hypothetical protein
MKYSFNYNQQDATLLLSMLYMFRAVSTPIIRSSKLYTQHLVYVKLAATASSFEFLMMGGVTA